MITIPHKVYAVLNQKGGAGKSTTAGHFAYWLHQRGNILFVDADGQKSASPWMEALGVPTLALSDPEKLFEQICLKAKEYDAIVVDGPGNASEVTKAILGCCDFVLIPNRPSDLDLRSSGTIVKFIKQMWEIKRGESPSAGFFLNAAKGERSVLLREAKETLNASSIPLLETVIYDLACITDSPGQQKTVFQMKGKTPKTAAAAYDALFQEVMEVLA